MIQFVDTVSVSLSWAEAGISTMCSPRFKIWIQLESEMENEEKETDGNNGRGTRVPTPFQIELFWIS